MSKTSESTQIVRVEVVSPEERSRPRISAADAQAMVREAIERQVAEVLERREDFIFQPFLTAKKVSDEIKRLQTVPEQRKWSVYFARHGCLICGDKKRGHNSCGMCSNCKHRVGARLKTCVRLAEKDREEWKDGSDHEELARQALLSSAGTPVLPAEPEPIRRQKRGTR